MQKKDFLLEDMIKNIEGNLGQTERIDVYYSESNSITLDSKTFYSAFVKKDYLDNIFKSYSRDIHIGDGKPGFICRWQGGNRIDEYSFYYNENVFPIVFYRTYPGVIKKVFEPLQEFCLYFNLYNDKEKDIYYDIDECGDYIEVIRVTQAKVSVKLKYLKEFAVVKDCVAVIYFEAMMFHEKPLYDLDIKEQDTQIGSKQVGYIYNHYINTRSDLGDLRSSQSWIIGKKIIPPLKSFSTDPFNSHKKYQEFIIGIDENGGEKLYTCNKEKCGDGFSKNSNKPYYLTPIYFKKEVLKKYYDNPSKYQVEDGVIYCMGFWTLRLDNNHDDCVLVFLGDLGDLPEKEQIYWRSFNIQGEGKMSYTGYQRAFEGEFCDPEQPDLYFKMVFNEFQESWFKSKGFYLFIPLRDEDKHYYQALHSPITNEIKELEEQILAITKIIIDSINEKEISKYIVVDDGDKGIKKLDKYLHYLGRSNSHLIDFLKDLQELRSTGVAHRKGKKYQGISQKFGIGSTKTYKEIFNDILIKSIRTINTLKNYLLRNSGGK